MENDSLGYKQKIKIVSQTKGEQVWCVLCFIFVIEGWAHWTSCQYIKVYFLS